MQLGMPFSRRLAAWSCLVLWHGMAGASHGLAADLQEIVGRGAATLHTDWAEDPNYAYVERDEVQKNGRTTSRKFQVVYIAGSDYDLPLAINDQPLTPEREEAEIEKLRSEVRHRNAESSEARRQRIEKYKKQRGENEDLVLSFPDAFNFELVREETLDGHATYVLSGTPKKRTGPLSIAEKVLSGMRGTVWLDKNDFHAVRVECDTVGPVPIYGILARVLPGTHIDFAMAPVTNSTWLISELSMNLTISKLGFKSKEVTGSTFSDYRLNDSVLAELLSK